MVEMRTYKQHMKNGNKAGFWYTFNLTAIILIALFAISIPLLHAYEQLTQSVDIEAVQKEPASVFIPSIFTVAISNASSTPLNAIEFTLQYDPKVLMVTKIIPHTTLCEERFIITNSINHASGTATFQCGTITPFSGVVGTIAEIQAIPFSSGTTTISFATSTTHVLAHDGYGTNVTRKIHDLFFTSI